MNTECHTPFEWFMRMYYTEHGWKRLMTYLTKIHISLLLLNQIGWSFQRNAENLLCFYNPEAYSG